MPYIKNKRLETLKPHDFDEFVDNLSNSGLSTSYKNKCIENIKIMFTYAVEFYELRKNPSLQLKRFSMTQEDLIKKYEKDFQVWDLKIFTEFYNELQALIKKRDS